jgi:hypothetical protein
MTHNRRILVTAPALAFIALCQGCASGPAFTGPIHLISNSDIVVVRAAARRKPDGILINGDVRRTNGYAGAVPGHLHVVGRDVPGGNVIAITDVTWGEFMSRRFRLAYYKAFLKTDNPSAVATITVEAVTGENP